MSSSKSKSKSEKNCRAKHRYNTRLDALMALSRIAYDGPRVMGEQEREAYSCPHCRGWHLTKQGGH